MFLWEKEGGKPGLMPVLRRRLGGRPGPPEHAAKDASWVQPEGRQLLRPLCHRDEVGGEQRTGLSHRREPRTWGEDPLTGKPSVLEPQGQVTNIVGA